MPIDKVDKLVSAIKANKLKETQHNLERVQEAWANCIVWNAAMEKAGLASLPDPEGVSNYPEVLEEWMVKAFSPTYTRKQLMKKLASVKEEILKEKDLR